MSLVNKILKGVRNLTLASILAFGVIGCSSSSKVSTPNYVPQIKTEYQQQQNSNASLEEYLSSELLSQIDVSKVTLKPPTGKANAVDDLKLTGGPYPNYTYGLTWTYKNAGDYNQDGVVDIKDITPLAANFGMESPIPQPGFLMMIDKYWRGDWVDGNKDGIINAGDITPLAANFGTECAGYKLQLYLNPETPGYEWIEIAKFDEAETGHGRKRFWVNEINGEPIKPGMAFYVYPMDSEGSIINTPMSNRVTVPWYDYILEIGWNAEEELYTGKLEGGMYDPSDAYFSEIELKNWNPNILPTQSLETKLEWMDWNLWKWEVEANLSEGQLELLPTKADFILSLYNTEDGLTKNEIVVQEKYRINFVAGE